MELWPYTNMAMGCEGTNQDPWSTVLFAGILLLCLHARRPVVTDFLVSLIGGKMFLESQSTDEVTG